MDKYQEEKVKKFEEFIDRRLKPDLVKAIAERDKVFEQQKILQIEEYTQLIASIKAQIKLVCEGIRELLQIPAE